MRPSTVFDKPQADLVPDRQGHRWYGNVDNLLQITRGGREHSVYVAVPTMLFPLMKEALRIAPDEAVTLSVDQLGEYYVFSLLAGDRLFDLWCYSEKGLPPWLLSRDYRA